MPNNLQYPLVFEKQNVPFMQFYAYDWQLSGKRSLLTDTSKKSIGNITLPMPKSGFEETFSIQWEEEEQLLLGAGLSSLAKKAVNSLRDIAGDLLKGTEFTTGKTVNDYASLYFNGVDFREFTFEFSMIPHNDVEAQMIVDIINFFKKYSLPDTAEIPGGFGGLTYLKYPSFWEAKIIFPGLANARMSKTIKFKDMVVTNVACNHFPDGITTLFKSGQPIKIDLSITVKELEKMYRSDY